MADETKMVIVARKDIKLSAGKLAAQVGHAAVSCTIRAQRYAADELRAWLDEGQKKVVLKAATERELFELKSVAEKAGLTTALIEDAGHTELPPGTVTVLGVGPASARRVDAVTGHLPLY